MVPNCLPLHLLSLNLSHNLLTNIPSCISQLKSLKKLNISYNSLTNCIFNDSTPFLSEIDVSNNQITSINGVLFLSSSLESFNVENNSLTSIPNEVALCTQLKTFLIKGNRLKSIPSSIINKGTTHILSYLTMKLGNEKKNFGGKKKKFGGKKKKKKKNGILKFH